MQGRRRASRGQIDCRGAFARDSSHIRLAQVFGPDNVTFTDVDGPDNTKMPASVLFPNDPARRLEMLWNNTSSRSGTQVIVINGKSAWAAPRGVKLGVQLAALEKINGKPFKLTAFGADGSTVADWQEGATAQAAGRLQDRHALHRRSARAAGSARASWRPRRNCCRATPTCAPCGRRWRKS